MTTEQLRLAHRRLWLGITNVGFWVLASATGLGWLSSADTTGLDLRRLGLLFVAVVAIQAVFDFIGGTVLMPEPRAPMLSSFKHWSRSVLVHSVLWVIVGLMSYISFRLTQGFGPAVVLATVGLALGRRHVLRAVAGIAAKPKPHGEGTILTAEAADPAFTGGMIGWGRRARSVVPASWLVRFSPEDLAAELWRRQWQGSSRLADRAFLLILGWNLLGSFSGTLIFRLAERTPAEAIFGHACWMTLWAFAGLLGLPALSRPAVFLADRAAVDAGLDPRPWIARFPGIIGEDGSADAAVQSIFYPIPSAALRLRQLDQPRSGFALGNLARSNLYYSWATLTLLGRAVHCNIGRPALWVFPPSA